LLLHTVTVLYSIIFTTEAAQMNRPGCPQKPFQPFPKTRAMTRRRYDGLLQTLKDQHPWASEGVLSPAPGHLFATSQMLCQIEAIVPMTGLQEMTFLSIATVNGAFTVKIELPMKSRARWDALHAAEANCAGVARYSCMVCGLPLQTGSPLKKLNGRCAKHEHCTGLFAEELRGVRARVASMTSDDFLQGPGDTASKSTTQKGPEPAEAAMPQVPFYELAELAKFERSIEARPKEQQARMTLALQQLQAAGGSRRKLGTLSTDWPMLVEEFHAHFPNFAQFAETLRDHFSLSSLGDRRIQLPPTLFVGPPGIGKTEAVQWLARRLALPFALIDMASAQSNGSLAGSEAFWGNSQPGQLYNLLASKNIANPLVMLDELDKVGGDERFDPLAPLYTLLEPSGAKRFIDLSIRDLAINASHVNWLATANSIERLPQPILSRFSVLRIAAPDAEQMRTIARNLYERFRLESPWGSHFAPALSDEVVARLGVVPPREIRLVLQRAFGAAARAGRTDILACDLCPTISDKRREIGFHAVY
jgi:ATP-dependent Lon protease